MTRAVLPWRSNSAGRLARSAGRGTGGTRLHWRKVVGHGESVAITGEARATVAQVVRPVQTQTLSRANLLSHHELARRRCLGHRHPTRRLR